MTITNPVGAKFATPLNRSLPNFGARVAKVAEHIGAGFMPWQAYVSAVATELDPSTPGAFRYPLVVVTVPRQAGKSYWLRAMMADRMLSYNRHEILMTAQTGKDAKKRWNQLVNALDAKKKTAFKVRESQGSEALTYLRRGSYISPFAPTPKSIHGDSLHLVTIDEAWAFDDVAGAALENAVNPTQLTITDGQIIIVSTRGTSSSSYLNALIEQGRRSVGDPYARMAYFEWSADDEIARSDPYSDAALAFHPAIGYTQTAEKIRALATGSETGTKGTSLSSYRRAYLNLPPLTESGLIDAAIWDGLAGPAPRAPAPAHVSLGFDVARDGSSASIVAAWMDHARALHLALLRTGPGTDWLAPTLTKLWAVGYANLGGDDTGPNRIVIADLLDETPDVTPIRSREYSTGCQLILDTIKSGDLVHDGHEAWSPQWETVKTKFMSGATSFDVERSTGPIDVLRAAACAAYLARYRPARPLQVF